MAWFKNQKVGIKIFISCMVFILLLILGSITAIAAIYNFEDEFDTFNDDRVGPIVQLNNIKDDMMQIRIDFDAILFALDENNTSEITERTVNANRLEDDYRNLFEDYIAGGLDGEEGQMADELGQYIQRVDHASDRFLRAAEALDRVSAESYYDEWISLEGGMRDLTDALIAYQVAQGNQIVGEAHAGAAATRLILYGFIVFSVFIGGVITLVLSRSVSGPVKLGLVFAERIARGDFTERIELDQKDELGQLLSALNSAADNLEELITDIVVASQNLAQAVEQISSGNQNLSQRTSEQASSLEEVASTIEETTSAINQNAENALEASKTSKDSEKLAIDGGHLVSDAVSWINDINEVSKKIGEIISMINEIAFQTNLLALNAAVEAARAGEQGRGFAVVAGEVRNLAQRSGNAAKEIGDLIKSSIEKIEIGTEKANKSGEALNEIIESVKDVTQTVGEIAAANNEQKEGVNQLNIAVTELDTMTQQNAALVEETASASEEMANQAHELIGMMDEFRIREQARREIKKEVADNKKVLTETGRETRKTLKQPENTLETEMKKPSEANDAENKRIQGMMKDEGFEEF